MTSARLLVFASSVVLVGGSLTWIGCASDATDGSPEAPTSSSSNTGSSSSSSPTTSGTEETEDSGTEEFDAGFPSGDAGGDPTPDGGDQCIDNDDPGAAENVAKGLPDTGDDDHNPKTINGTIDGAADVDFYKFKGSDTFGSEIDFQVASTTSGLEVCAFLACAVNQPTNFKQCDQGTETTSDIGEKGCCTATPGTVAPNWSCGGTFDTDDTANVYIRVKQSGDKCLPYSVTYHF